MKGGVHGTLHVVLNTEDEQCCKLRAWVKCPFHFPCNCQQVHRYSCTLLNHLCGDPLSLSVADTGGGVPGVGTPPLETKYEYN